MGAGVLVGGQPSGVAQGAGSADGQAGGVIADLNGVQDDSPEAGPSELGLLGEK